MAPDPVVRLEDVSREFGSPRVRRTLFRILRGRAAGGAAAAQRRVALQDVSLAVHAGERFAVIGNNAAGKSTLLKVIAGLLRPTSGRVTVHGELILLTTLGLGMIDDLSIEENLFLYGAIYGLDRPRMRPKLADIVEWAELDGSLDAQLRTLSSGTRARLAFSVIRHIESDIFLLDEALSAGDVGFRRKCQELFEPRRNGAVRTFIVTTHDMEFARNQCARTLWLDRGRAMAIGPSAEVVAAYLEAQGRRRAAAPARGHSA
jgi:ABC-type polysaccharide/polyol phosphate transport system ATPase subunit